MKNEHVLQELPISIPKEIEAKCFFNDGVFYVASDCAHESRIIEFEMRLMRLGVIREKVVTTLTDISNKRKEAQNKEHSKRVLSSGKELKTALAFLEKGVELKASDIHFVFRGSVMEVKYRIDGFLDKYAELPADEGRRIISALYVESDVKNKGSFSFDAPIAARLNKGLSPDLYAVRFASMKSDAGGVVVLRLLYNAVANRSYGKSIDLETLGFNDEQVKLLRAMASAPNGMIIIDGPTGSGKSTTLKYVLQWVHEHYPQFNILTVEDPPEYPIVGAQQIPVVVQDSEDEDINARSRAYANVINTTLRLDPDILMIGEIRDGVTAISALRAAITGHRLWTTIHANDAWEAMNRLIDLLREGGMRDPLPVLANTQNLTGLIAQRLIPTLCPHCKVTLREKPNAIEKDTLEELMQAMSDFSPDTIYVRGDGCQHCVPVAKNKEEAKADTRRGIMGRTVCAEIVKPDQKMLDIAREKGIPAARHFWLKHRNGKTIADIALEKIKDGIVDPQVARDFIGPLISAKQIVHIMDDDVI